MSNIDEHTYSSTILRHQHYVAHNQIWTSDTIRIKDAICVLQAKLGLFRYCEC